MKNLKKMLFAVTIATLPFLSACGGDGGGNGTVNPPNNGQVYLYSVGGTVTGLNGTLVLQNNGGNSVNITGNGSFTFSTRLADGAAYYVTVSNQPRNQTCEVQKGSGTIRSVNITDIQVVCTNNTGGVTLSGKIAVPPGVIIDGSVNDLNEDYTNNETFDTAQVIPNPISVGGYVNQTEAGPCGRLNICDRYYYVLGNTDDYYLVQLKTGDAITLAIGDIGENPISGNPTNDLNLYLYDINQNLVAASVGGRAYRFIEVKSPLLEGTYYVNVHAVSGASNYILMIGADMASAAIAYADPGILSTQHEIAPGQVIVRFKDTAKTAASINRTFAQYMDDMGFTVIAGSPEREMLLSIDNLKLQADANNTGNVRQKSYERSEAGSQEMELLLNTLMAVKELRKQPDVLSADPNYIVRAYSTVPNDAYYGLQWNLPLINLPEAWDVPKGKGSKDVIVAVVDSGVLVNHPDLRGRLTDTGYNFVQEGGSGAGTNPNDPGDRDPGSGKSSSFHGTHVSGIIAATTNNNVGVSGVTWETMIMPVRVIGSGGSGDANNVIQGIRYAAGLSNNSGRTPSKRADIINLSLGSYGGTCVYQEAINQARAQGVIVIAAAGNDNRSTPSYPANCNGVISVSAVNIDGTKASYSNYGSNISTIDVAAPGGDSGDLNGDGYPDYILSTGGDDTSGSIDYRYTFLAGTSMAAPHVSGVAALMKAVHPGLSSQDFEDLLSAGKITNDIGAANYYGHGLINAFKAVAAAEELAGGGSVAGLDVNPRTINFGVLLSEASVTVSKIGAGAISVIADKNADWLTIIPNTVDGSGFGRYTIRVNRSSPSLHQEGAYTAVVTFTPSFGTPVSVSVTAQVRSTDTDITYDAGQHYIQLRMINEDGTSILIDEYGVSNGESLGVKASGGYYFYSFNNVQPGEYWIVAGSDRNNNFTLGDAGEAFGAYPPINQIDYIIVESSDINIPDFTTNLMLSISENIVSGDKPALSDKPVAIPAEFKRLFISPNSQ